MTVTAIVVGGGRSSRMKGVDKLMMPLCGKTVFQRSIEAMCQSDDIDAVVAVAREDLVDKIEPLKALYPKLTAVVKGGETRALSVICGIDAAPDSDYFAVHDAARPFVSPQVISRVLSAAVECGAAAPAANLADTVKVVDEGNFVSTTLNRSVLRAVQTPQIFKADLYREAIKSADENALDDCFLFERRGYPVKLVEGDSRNFKITTREDMERARMQAGDFYIRIGHGYDVHKLVENRALILGGVNIPYEKGLLGHSDADVLLHAICDALLGAAALRDIGYHFPDTDPAYSGADSRVLLRRCVELIGEKGFVPSSVDATVIAQRPKLMGYIGQMAENVAADLGIERDCVNIKATTEEHLGFTGRGEGISAHAVALIRRA